MHWKKPKQFILGTSVEAILPRFGDNRWIFLLKAEIA